MAERAAKGCGGRRNGTRRMRNWLTDVGGRPDSPGKEGTSRRQDDDLDAAALTKAKTDVAAVLDRGVVVFVALSQERAGSDAVNQLLPAPVQLAKRQATTLLRNTEHPWVAGFGLPDLYFAEDTTDRFILKCGLAGPFVEKGRVLLEASTSAWSLFGNRPETTKCAAEVLYEQLAKPGGAALVENDSGKGTVVVCALDWRIASRAADGLWRKLLANMGIKLGTARDTVLAAFDEKGVLLNALGIGRFGAADVDAAMAKDFLGTAGGVGVSVNSVWYVRSGGACSDLVQRRTNA
ncbi:MAG: hypothetical protein NTW87_08215 [Planctomycetota bacterium]|nr:hypothetical protein [Planctomycetota bacterium]